MNLQNETPEFEDVIRDAIRAGMMDLHVCLPARIEKYDKDRQEADVQPLLKKKYRKNDEVVSLPVIPSIPVHFFSSDGGNARMTFPIKTGDLGYVHIFDRSIDKWLSGDGSEVLPGDVRIHNLTDAVFVPGIRPFQNALAIENNEDVFLVNSASKIQMTPSGDILLEGGNSKIYKYSSGDIIIEGGDFKITIDPAGRIKAESVADELLKIISDLTQNLIDALVVTGIGAQPFTSATITSITAIKTRIEAMRLT